MKQRLVGTLVLGCLALIFISLLLDGDGITPSDIDTRIPEQPVISLDDLPPPQRPVIEADNLPLPDPEEEFVSVAEEAIALPLPDGGNSAMAEADPETIPARDANGLPATWSVRMGVFGQKANADALLKRLLDAGYKAYSRPVQNENGSFTGIFVGPVITRSEANELKNQLADEFAITGIVADFSVREL